MITHQAQTDRIGRNTYFQARWGAAASGPGGGRPNTSANWETAAVGNTRGTPQAVVQRPKNSRFLSQGGSPPSVN